MSKEIREVLVFTGGIVDINGSMHPSFYRIFPYWRLSDGS